jgi:acetylornithine deacetylase/succinyl-diaminopimelate desuccinylase-like protein
MADISAFAHDRTEALVAGLATWCAIPSISTDPAFSADVRRSAEHLAGLMTRAGLSAEVVDVPGGQPAVLGEWLGAGPDAPTVTIYGHHDVQPVTPLELWTSPPFEPVVRDGALYARGASDDKGQIHLQVAAVGHLLATDGRLPVNVKFFVEGEEEAGSPNIDAFLAAYAERLACDVIVVADTGMHDAERPTLVTSMRGMAYFQLDLRTSGADLHSGEFGGTVPNAVAALVELLGKLKDADGRIQVPGWYDEVLELTPAERDMFAELHFDEDAFKRTADVTELPGEAGYSPLERIGGRPSCDVNGIWGGYIGAGSMTIIPAEAHAKVSFRLVADQDPAVLGPRFRQWVADNTPAGATVTVQDFGGVKPCLTPLDHPANLAAARAVERAFGVAPLFSREGGSGPERALSDALGAPCVYIGTMLPGDRIHAPDEHFEVRMYTRGLVAAAYALEELGSAEVAARLVAARNGQGR